MASFEKFGITSVGVASPALSDKRCELGYNAYVEQAFDALYNVSDFVVTELSANLSRYEGKWHPSGFMVYPLGMNPDLGMLRLHVWPDEDRKVSEKGDTIHNHAWYIASLVLRGSYHDTILDIKPEGVVLESERKTRGLLRLFDASYNPDASQELKTDGTCVRVSPRVKRTVHQTETHAIEPGVFHQPSIPKGRAVATLVFSSFRVCDQGPYVLIDAARAPIPESRLPLSEKDRYTTKQLLAA